MQTADVIRQHEVDLAGVLARAEEERRKAARPRPEVAAAAVAFGVPVHEVGEVIDDHERTGAVLVRLLDRPEGSWYVLTTAAAAAGPGRWRITNGTRHDKTPPYPDPNVVADWRKRLDIGR